jgi:ABC-type multidrug transport system fused ATPase/permease subunit
MAMHKNDVLASLKVCVDVICHSGARLKLLFVGTILLDLLTVGLSVAAPWVLKNLIDTYNSGATAKALAIMGILYGATWLASELVLRVRAVTGTDVLEEIKTKSSLRFCMNTIFNMKAAPSLLNGGVFATKLNQLNGAFPVFIEGIIGQVIPLIVRLALSILVLAQFVSWTYSLALGLTVISFACVSLVTFKYIGHQQRATNEAVQSSFGLILDILANRNIVLSHAAEAKEIHNIESSLSKTKFTTVRSVYVQQMSSGAQIVVLGIGLATVTAFAGFDLASKNITLGDFFQINAYLLQFVLPVSYFGMVISGVKRASVTIHENYESLLPNLEAFESPLTTGDAQSPEIHLSDVSVTGDNGAPILSGITLRIRSKHSLAVVGPSGAGKSTLAKVVLGLVAPSRGLVTANSIPVAGAAARALRLNTGYAAQDTYLFQRTVRANLSSKHDLNDAQAGFYLTRAGFGPSMTPDLLNREITQLSGGEKQRVSLARAAAREAGLLVLDEPTASLDLHTKSVVSDLLYGTHSSELTRIIVTHDLTEARRANHVLVLCDGEMIQYGTHEELLDSDGWYRKQWARIKEHDDEATPT